ncbi:hypothetical protein EV401DRAFT_1868684, partial [Pisolithus croceorrhizus]
RLMTRPFWQSLSADIFAGQIIASLIVLTFVAVFLLREWISQNARPGVFEEEDLVVPPPMNAPVLEPIAVVQDLVEPDGRFTPQHHSLWAGTLQQAERTRRQARFMRRAVPAPLEGYSFRPELMHDALSASEMSSYVHPGSVHQDPLSASVRDEVLADSARGPSAEESKENLEVDATAPVVLGKHAFAPSSSEPYVPIRTPSPEHEFVSTSHIQTGPAFQRFPVPTTLAEGLASTPGIAMYAPPEELEAGPSSAAGGHMDQGEFVRQEMQDEFSRYFHEPDVPNDVLEAPHPGPDPNGLRRPAVPAEDDDEDEDGDVDLDVEDLDREEDEDEDEDEDEFGNFNIVNRPGVQPQQAQLQEAAEQINDGADDLEAGVEDDMEGALEAIGLRGPLFGVVQNAVLMVLVLNTAMGFGIWLPFTLGKTVALLSLDPPRAFHILHLPIRAMRVITDPMVDSVTFLLSRSVPPLFYMALDLLFRFVLFTMEKTMGPAAAATVVKLRSWTSQGVELLERLLQWLRSPPEEPSPGLSGQIEKFFENNSAVARFLEPYFAEFGHEIRLITEQAQKSWVHLALGHGTPERTFAICLGYTVITICLAFYLNVFTVGNARSAGRAVRNAVRQQLLVVKVAMFIIIELVIFPLGCGIMLDACTIWVFPEASFASRISFFAQAPLTAMFYHWVAGTMFMYQFAILLAGCRSIMRPGAMWFIKDPQDQNFHPIRDILDRPTLTQFRKLLISAFMYSMVVACGVGSLAILLFIGSKSIFPIRWKTREPLSDVPIDLLFLQIVLPYTMRHLRPRKVLHDTSIYVWRYLASKLRLTSYMFGDRPADQEETVHYRTWIAFFLRSTKDAVTEHDGTFRRVPASDNIALPRDMRATAEVFENGFPRNEEARDLIRQQNNEAAKAKRDIKADYTVVYFPPHFRARILTFVGAVWTIVAIAVAVCIALPVQIGRRFFALFTTSELHDGYSFLVGFYLLWACYAVSQASERMNKRRLRINGPKPGFIVFFAKRSLLWLSKIAYMVVMFGIVIPTLLGLVVDVYVVLPIRLTLNPTMVPNIRIVDMWSLGLIYGKIAIRLRRRIQFPNRIAQALQTLLGNGWSNPDPQQATKELIFPLVAGLLGMLVLPAGFVYFLREIVGLSIGTKFLLVHVYPGIFAAAGLSRMCVSVMSLLSTWSQAVRDKEFLVEMRLQNHEPGKLEEEGKGDTSIEQERAAQ